MAFTINKRIRETIVFLKLLFWLLILRLFFAKTIVFMSQFIKNYRGRYLFLGGWSLEFWSWLGKAGCIFANLL